MSRILQKHKFRMRNSPAISQKHKKFSAKWLARKNRVQNEKQPSNFAKEQALVHDEKLFQRVRALPSLKHTALEVKVFQPVFKRTSAVLDCNV